MAERYDRSTFGRQDTQVNVAVGIGDEFLAALKRIEEWAKAKKEAKAKAKSEQISESEVGEADCEIVEEDEEPSPPSSNQPVPNLYKTTKKRLSRGVSG